MTARLFGVTVAMITPFKKDGPVNEAALKELTEALLSKGVDCLYPCGTTGEFPSMTVAERERVADIVIKKADGRCPVFVHVGGDTEEHVSQLLAHACENRASGAGIVTPTFLGMNDKEMVAYYVRLAKQVPRSFPLYLYSIPQCAANDISAAVAREIREKAQNVVGIKYSYPDFNRLFDYVRIPDFSVLHGCDRLFSALLALGASGTVSGCAGVFPEPFVGLYQAWREKDREKRESYQKSCAEIVDILKAGSNMAYFKSALKYRGIDECHMKFPHLDLTEKEEKELFSSLDSFCERNKVQKRF